MSGKVNINPLFTQRMEEELVTNSHKGDWVVWHPEPKDWLWEMSHHQAKLQKAIADKNYELIREYSADVANLAEKAFVSFGNIKDE